MRCNECLEAMLSCEPRSLRGVGTDAVAEHVRYCERCGAVGAKLIGATTLVGAVGTASVPRPTSQRRNRAILVATLPIAAAFVAIIRYQPALDSSPMVVATPPSVVGPHLSDVGATADQPSTVTAAPAPPMVQVTSTNGKRAAIIRTADPKVTIIWLY